MADRLYNITQNRSANGKLVYKNIEYPDIPIQTSDIYIISKSTDRLDLLASDYYNDSKLWWVISRANPDKISKDSFFIRPGLQIRIPRDVEAIYSAFENLNK